MSSMSSQEFQNENAALGMGVWGSGIFLEDTTGNTRTQPSEPSTVADSKSESKSDQVARPTSIGRPRSISLEVETSLKQNPADHLYVSELLKCPYGSQYDEEGESYQQYDRLSSSKRGDKSGEVTPNQSDKTSYMAQYIPPTWDPQTDFCFPVQKVPVVRLVPDNLEISHFTHIQHIADGSNANIFLADLNDETVIIKMIRYKHSVLLIYEYL
jgi:hypothetical protein